MTRFICIASIVIGCVSIASAQAEEPAQPTRPFLQGHLSKHILGVRSLPEGMEPDFIIGHFMVSVTPLIHIKVDGPVGSTIGFSSKLEKKWLGKQYSFCRVLLKRISDGSGGYYFTTIAHRDGPRGWLMPRPKADGDTVVPWAIYFDQPDEPIGSANVSTN